MKEGFVSYKIAKKLKEEGFNRKCFAYYMPSGGSFVFNANLYRGGTVEDCLHSSNSLPYYCIGSECVDVPTIEQVLEWLREEKKIYMVAVPYPSMSTKDKVVWCYQIKHNSDGDFMEEIDSPESYMHYRDVVIAGIEYVIDNLI